MSNQPPKKKTTQQQAPQPPALPKPESESAHPTYFEKYFDPTYQRPYFFNPLTGDTLWEIPAGSLVADMTAASLMHSAGAAVQEEPAVPQQPSKKEDLKKKEQEDKHREEYKRKQ